MLGDFGNGLNIVLNNVKDSNERKLNLFDSLFHYFLFFSTRLNQIKLKHKIESNAKILLAMSYMFFCFHTIEIGLKGICKIHFHFANFISRH